MILRTIQQAANRIALPFNVIALLGVLTFGWLNYQNVGFHFTTWLPVALVGTSLTLSLWAKGR